MIRTAPLAIVLTLVVASLAAAQTPHVATEIGQAMQDRDYQAAIQAIDEAMEAPESPGDYLTYLKGRIFHYQGKYDEAVRTFEFFKKTYDNSPWARRVRFAQAVSQARMYGFRQAELIYREEAEYLLSADRKQEIADIYLEFATTYFKPKDQDKKPDFQKALEFYQKALEVGPKAERRIEVELLVAQCYQNLGKHDEANKRYTRFIDDYPNHSLDIEARFRLGDCQLQQNAFAEARRTWQDLLAKHADVQSPRIAEATYRIAKTYQVPKPRSRGDLDLGVAALRSFVTSFPDHKLAAQAYLNIAQSYQAHGRFEDAAAALTELLDSPRYQKRDEVAEARFLLGQCFQRQKKFESAIETWRGYLTKHPAHQRWSDAQRLILDTEYLVAAEKRDSKKYGEARNLWTVFLGKYPLDERAPQILYTLGQMNAQQEKWDNAMSDWRRLVSKYPNTDPASAGQYMIAVTLEEKLDKYEEAIQQYKKVTWGSHESKARSRIARLTAKQMRIRTNRVFRSDESPSVQLTTRNIEKVTVRAYRIDLETYFRKMHLATGVESLDIALIDPNETFEFEIPNYVKHKESDNSIELPETTASDSNEGGVLVVTVSSETLEATTMVMQSDLDIIVKSSRDEVFVFAQNMQTGNPWPEVRLLISDGSQVFAEVQTGDDGVFQQTYEQLKSAKDVRVFAVTGQHTASNVVGLQGLGVASGLSNKGYIYTDRSAYRPGQMVNIRGVVRRVANDTYEVEEDKTFQLHVYDTRNRPVLDREVKLSRFGSFHTHFVLPQSSPQGSYRILLTDKDRQQYQGTFSVHQYKLESVQLTVDSDRQVYYRGEDIVGKITAKYYYGAPLVGREIRYRLADGRLHTARTDEHGQVEFTLPTRERRETQVLPLVAELPELGLATSHQFVLAAQEYSLSLSTIRPCYLTGETFEVTVKAADAEGKPTSRELVLSILQQTVVDGRSGERLVDKKKVKTEKETGEGHLTLNLKKGAHYTLRVEGTDRFENPITGQHVVQISGEDDETRLRILANRHTYKVGDSPVIEIHWRDTPALALVTYQGARVLDYRLVELKKGTNALQIPMTAKLAPNFELAVAIMTNAPADSDNDQSAARRLHTASSPFTVQRDLVVKVEPKLRGDRKVARPGEMLEVTVTTTDPQGKPVDAEVSLAMVQQALLDRFGSAVPSIGPFFRGEDRQSAVRTTASVTFNYRPATRKISSRLLAEEERLAVEEVERERLAELDGEDPFGGGEYAARRYVAFEMVDNDAVVLHSRGMAAPTAGVATSNSAWSELTSRRRSNVNGGTALGLQLGQQVQQQGAMGMGGGGMGGGGGRGGRDADFDSLIELTTETIQPDTWDRQDGMRSYHSTSGLENGRSHQWGYAGYKVSELYANGGDGSGLMAKLNEFSFKNQSNGVVAITKGGAVSHYNYTDLQGSGGQQLLEDLRQADAVLLPGLPVQETGYWNPAIRTGSEGSATVKFTMPDHATAWKLLAKGVTTETLAGEGEQRVVAEKDLFGDLKLPLAFTDGDLAKIVATVHSANPLKGEATVTLKTTIGKKTSEQTQTIDAGQAGQQQVVFESKLQRPDNVGESAEVHVTLELVVSCGEQTDNLQRVVPLQPYGLPVFGAASGTADSDTTAWVQLPTDMPTTSPSLQIVIGPTVEQGMLDVLFGPPLACQLVSSFIAPPSDTAASDLMAGVALQSLLGKTRNAENPQAAAVNERIRSSISALVSSQRDDGGWSWATHQGDSSGHVSARTVWALMLAARAGYTLPDATKDKAINFLRTQITQAANSGYESKAILLHALAVASNDDFPLANRLYRDRPSLSTAALLHLSMALFEMQRESLAEDILKLVAARDLDESQPRRKSSRSSLPWNHSPVELRALYAIALQQIRPADAKVQTLVDWLLAHRVGHRWSPDKATGPASLAACRWLARSRFTTENYKLAVYVNNRRVKVLEFDKDARTETIQVPVELLEKTRQRINFQLTGRGRFSYQCVMEGFVAADRIKSTTSDWRVRRYYEAASLERDGKTIPRGFDVLRGNYTTFRNPLTQLPVGRRGHVTLQIWRDGVPADTPAEHLEYLVVTEPLPCGATVIEDSIKGGHQWYEIGPGAITFYLGNRRHISNISYDIHGFLPGQYRAAPAVVRDAYRPDRFAAHEPNSLTVLALGTKSTDAYRLTPRELYELGKWRFERKDWAEAAGHLNQLVDQWNLKPDVLKEATRLLLDAHLETGPPRQVVRHFEVIKERWPELEIPYGKILKIGSAYHDMGEYERAYLIFRATVESSFLTESQVAGFLQSQDELLRGVDVMSGLLREYPPEPYVAAATFDLAQQVYAMAPQAKSNKQMREAKITRVDLVRRAASMLDSFLTTYPEDPGADQAAFSMATALLELEQYKPTIEACHRSVKRYPESDDLDSFWYTIGFCHFALGEHQQALDVCHKVAKMKRKDPETGRLVEASNRYRAIYILGQIYHSLGEAAKAITEYTRVEGRFADAKEAIQYFTRRGISLPEVTTVAPGKPAQVPLDFRNVDRCEVKVYRIDLMKFSLLRRNLSGITNINLAGIHPLHEETIQLGDGKDYRDRKRELELPLKTEGAYLVVCRGGDLHASGLVLRSPLEVEVQEQTESGRVRTTVRNTTEQKYVHDVHVKVIGSDNEDFVSGDSDLRGVFVADGIRGQSTVIAQADGGRYAFYRGSTHLGPLQPEDVAKSEKQVEEAEPGAKPGESSNDLLEGLYLRNTIIQGENLRRQKEQYFNEKSGVTVEAVK